MQSDSISIAQSKIRVEDQWALDPDILQKKGYTIVQEIGGGSQGKVFSATNEGQLYAIKRIDRNYIKQNIFLHQYLYIEVGSMRAIKSEHTVKLIDAFWSPEYYYLVMEYCTENLLAHLLRKTQKEGLSEAQGKNYLYQILWGLLAIHQQGYAHRDLKPENVLVGVDGKLKIGDFGLCQSFEQKALQTLVGTEEFSAPEILGGTGDVYDYKIDIWSLGVLFFTMLFYLMPFQGKNNQQLLQKIQKLANPETKFLVDQYPFRSAENIAKAKALSAECKDLFKKMLVIDASERIDFFELAMHPFFYDIRQNNNLYISKVQELYGSKNQLLKSLINSKKVTIMQNTGELAAIAQEKTLKYEKKNSVIDEAINEGESSLSLHSSSNLNSVILQEGKTNNVPNFQTHSKKSQYD